MPTVLSRLTLAAAAIAAMLAPTAALGQEGTPAIQPERQPTAATDAEGGSQDEGAQDDAGSEGNIRIVREPGKSVALEVGSTSYGHPDGTGPVITLVGAVHIGDASYYRAAQERLDAHEVVLYESVKPAGAGGAGGTSMGERQASTRAGLEFLSGLIADYRAKHDRLPEDFDTLRAAWVDVDPRFGQFIDAARIDAWGHPVHLVWDASAVTEPAAALDVDGYRVMSFGADGKAGGEREDKDLSHTHAPRDADAAEEGDRIQAELAHALGLEFQLDAVDYRREDWICSDMAADQIERSMLKHGLEFELLEGSLAGTSFPAQVAQFLLRTVRFADAFTGGAIGDTIKVLLIEMLGDEDVVHASLGQLAPGFVEVIINERNDVVMEDLGRLLEERGDVESVAIFYGAGHLPDLDAQLRERFGYEPVETAWDRAIEVDLERSAVTERDVRMIRLTVARMLRQMNQMK